MYDPASEQDRRDARAEAWEAMEAARTLDFTNFWATWLQAAQNEQWRRDNAAWDALAVKRRAQGFWWYR